MYIRGNTCGSYWLAFIIVVNVYALRMHKGIAHLMERGSWFCIRTQTSVLQCTLRVCIIDRFGDMMQLIFLMLSVSYSLCIFQLIHRDFFGALSQCVEVEHVRYFDEQSETRLQQL